MRQRRSSAFQFAGYLRWIFFAILLGSFPALLNLFVDPYELLFDKNRSGHTAEIAEKAHYPLWKLSGYVLGRYDTVVLGDSRARALREKYWDSLQFSPTKNLAYGGGTIPEIYETFKLVQDDPALTNLVVGIQLRSFDEDHKKGMNRVPEAVSLINSPVKYVFNWSVAKTSANVLAAEYRTYGQWMSELDLGVSNAHATDVDGGLNVLGMGVSTTSKGVQKNRFGRTRELPKKFARQVTRNARSDWRRFEVSETYWSYIERIGQWAKDNDKNLVFVIPPTIAEMQQTIVDYGLTKENENLRSRLAQWGLVLDFDYPDTLTEDLANFTDAYHFNAKVARQIVGEVISKLTSNKSTIQRVEKRRKLVRCNGEDRVSATDAKLANIQVQTGSSCRVWGAIAS